MSEVNINYKGSKIAGMDASGTKTLETQGKYCEDDIEVVYTRPSGGQPNLQTKNKSYTPTETAQSEAVAADNGYDGLERVNVSVEAIDSEYVGSDVPRKSSSDLTASGAAITAPAGYYAQQAQKSVASGTAGTPTASKGTVNNHAVTVTPSVTNQEGYIAGGTKNGAGVSVSASELVSGTKEITENGTNIDVTNYEKVNVAVPTGGGGDSMNIQVDNACHRVGSSTKTQLASLTVAKAGKYDIYWSAFRSNTSSQYTNGTECRVNGTTQGSEKTSWTNSYMQANKISGVTLAKNDVVTIWGRSRGSNYYVGCMNFTLIQVE